MVAAVGLLKEELGVVGPDITASISHTPCNAEDEHPRHEEGADEENESLVKREIFLLVCLVSEDVLCAFRFSHSYEYDRRDNYT